jgi:hypothetical protein
VAVDTSKVFKIKYSLNTLAQLSEYVKTDPETGERTIMNEDISLLTNFVDSDELSVFETEHLEHLIVFKW